MRSVVPVDQAHFILRFPMWMAAFTPPRMSRETNSKPRFWYRVNYPPLKSVGLSLEVERNVH
jgi:hypothetical protein